MNALTFLLIGITLASGFSNQNERFKRQAPRALFATRTQSHTRDGVPILSESYARSKAIHPDHGLSLYEDFVNDPWKPTEDLHRVITGRQSSRRPEVRSGHQRTDDPRDNFWSRQETSGRIQSRVTERPSRYTSRDGSWGISSQTGEHITYVRPKNLDSGHQRMRGAMGRRRSGSLGHSTRTRHWENYSASSNYQAPPYGEHGDADWVVESRSDGHVTYRRRGAQTNTQRLGLGEGEVLARVVKTDESDETVTSSDKKYDPTGRGRGRQPWRPALQLKSGDSVSYVNEDGTEVLFSRYRGQGRPTLNPYTTVRPERYEQEGDWRVVSKDDSHITWTRIGSEMEKKFIEPVTTTPKPFNYMMHTPTPYSYMSPTATPYSFVRSTSTAYSHVSPTSKPYSYVIPTHMAPLPRQFAASVTQGPWYRHSRTEGGPHYPMLHERETAERANRLGTSNRLVY